MTDAEYLRLDSPSCTAIWEVSDTEAPLWRYWGPCLPDGVTPGRPAEHATNAVVHDGL